MPGAGPEDLRAAPDSDRSGHALPGVTGVASRPYHPIVRLDYFVRLLGCPLAALIIVSTRWHEPTGSAIWPALALYALAWPTLAFLVASQNRDPKRVELINLMVDCALFGVWAALVSFRPLQTGVFVTGILCSAASVGGWRLFVKGGLVLAAGAGATGWLATGFRFAADESALTVALSIAALFLNQLLLAFETHHQARRLVQGRHYMKEQAEQISRQNIALDEALQQQTATTEALKLMNRSPVKDLEPVLQNIIESAARLCAADFGIIYRFDGRALRPAFYRGFTAAFERVRRYVEIPPGR